MTVGAAKSIARQWVAEHSVSMPGLWAVFFNGSINWLPDSSEFGACSDVDLRHVIHGDQDPSVRQQKIQHRGIVIEQEFVSHATIADQETVLGAWIWAPQLSVPSVIYDPTGELSTLQRAVAAHYAEPRWVRRRWEGIAVELRRDQMPQMATASSLDDRTLAFLFTVNNMQQVPLVAALKPPTVRRSGMLFTEVTKALGEERLGEARLEVLGSVGMSRADVEALFKEATGAWERAAKVWRTPIVGDFDLCPAARPIVIDGTRDLIDRGYHREAVFMILMTHWFAKVALKGDAPREYESDFRCGYERLTRALGIDSHQAFERKALLADGLLSKMLTIAEAIMDKAGRSPPAPPAAPLGL